MVGIRRCGAVQFDVVAGVDALIGTGVRDGRFVFAAAAAAGRQQLDAGQGVVADPVRAPSKLEPIMRPPSLWNCVMPA